MHPQTQEDLHSKASSQPGPKPTQLPVQGKGGREADRQCDQVVGEEVGVAANDLPADAAQDAVAHGGERVEQLHQRTHQHNL